MFIPPKYWDLDAKNSPIFGINMTICFKRHCNNYGLIYQSLEHLCHSYWKNWDTFTNLRDLGSFLLSMTINNNKVSFLQVMAGNRCFKSYLEHSWTTTVAAPIIDALDKEPLLNTSRTKQNKKIFFEWKPLSIKSRKCKVQCWIP